MRFLAHRGCWHTEAEKNTLPAFQRSFENGFGIETDVRDHVGQLSISHDLPTNGALALEDVLRLHADVCPAATLALNIKSDGLQSLLLDALDEYNVENYFLFDMSVPDAVISISRGLRCFTRLSEFERQPALASEAAGVWIDGFRSDWMTAGDLHSAFEQFPAVCVVSPELHQRDYTSLWATLKNVVPLNPEAEFFLCTDHPQTAREFFRA